MIEIVKQSRDPPEEKEKKSCFALWSKFGDPGFQQLEQSGTKPNLLAKILATKFVLFFLLHECFQKYVQYESNDNVIKYHGLMIPHDWDVSFEKFGGLPTVVAFWENLLPMQGQINFSKCEPQWV